MDSIRIKPELEIQMLHELSFMAQKHVDSSTGRLELLPVDPDKFPAQRAYHIAGSPIKAAGVASIATTANPKFPVMQQQLEALEEQSRQVSLVGEILESGCNIVLSTNHGDLIDIALAEAALYCELEKTGYKPRTAIIISKMVSMLAYRLGENTVPAAEALTWLCDDIFLSFPRTETMHRSGLRSLLPDEIQRHNHHMRHDVSEALEEGGMLLAVAPSGTTDKKVGDGVVSLGPVNRGTAELMAHTRTLVLPMAVWLGEKTVFTSCDIPRAVKNEEGAHAVMSRIAATLSSEVSTQKFIYARPIGGTALRHSQEEI